MECLKSDIKIMPILLTRPLWNLFTRWYTEITKKVVSSAAFARSASTILITFGHRLDPSWSPCR